MTQKLYDCGVDQVVRLPQLLVSVSDGSTIDPDTYGAKIWDGSAWTAATNSVTSEETDTIAYLTVDADEITGKTQVLVNISASGAVGDGYTLTLPVEKVTTWYVDASAGSDTGLGTAEDPLETIDAAEDRASAGDTVRIMAGSYTGHGYGKEHVTYQFDHGAVVSADADITAIFGGYATYHVCGHGHFSDGGFNGVNILSFDSPGDHVEFECESVDCSGSGPYSFIVGAGSAVISIRGPYSSSGTYKFAVVLNPAWLDITSDTTIGGIAVNGGTVVVHGGTLTGTVAVVSGAVFIGDHGASIAAVPFSGAGSILLSDAFACDAATSTANGIVATYNRRALPSAAPGTASGLSRVSDLPSDAPSAENIAAAVESAIVNEGDATAVLQAIADRIANDLTVGDLTTQAIAAAVWQSLTSTFATTGSVGKLLTDQVDAAISSRSTFDATSDSVTVGANNDKAGYSLTIAPPTAEQVAAAVAAEPSLATSENQATILDKLDELETTNIPVTQIPVPIDRTWILKATGDGLRGELPLSRTVGEEQLFAVDFRNDLPNNGRLVSLDAVSVSGAPSGIVITAEECGVDRSQAKLKINLVEVGAYVVTVRVTYDDSDGGGTSEGSVTLIVKPSSL